MMKRESCWKRARRISHWMIQLLDVRSAKQRKKIEFQQAIHTMTRDEWTDAVSVWDSVESTRNSTADGMADGVSDDP